MKLVIAGAGEVGSYLCALLSEMGHDVTVVDANAETCRRLDELYNARVVEGHGESASILKDAQVDGCDYFLAMTSDDKTNLIASSLAKALGAHTVITRIHDATYSDSSHVNYQVHFGIDFMLNPEMLSAIELAKSIRNPARVAVESFARGQIEAQRFEVSGKSKAVGRPLKDLKLPPKVRFGYLVRGEHQEVPSANTTLEAGDVVTIFGPANDLFHIRREIGPKSSSEERRVVIVGGSEVAIALLRLLNNPRFKVRVIEQKADKCERLAARFPFATFINGDGTSLRLMEEEQIGGADYFVASTTDDERNILTATQARKLGCRHVQAVINKSDYEDILLNMQEALGIETIVSPRKVTAQEVLRYISKEPYIELFRFQEQGVRILEIKVLDHSPAAGKLLREVRWPPRSVAVALLHKFQAFVPGADDKILAGDRIVVIVLDENIREIVSLFHP
jgi:trk system potassium uptake protein TrkA